MKTLKKFFIIFACVLGILLIDVSETQAAKLAPFPNSKTLQPMPDPDVHPNISGNINSTVGAGSQKNVQEKTSLSESERAVAEEQGGALQDNPKSKSGGVIFWFITLGLTLGVIVIARYFRQKRNAPNA